MTAQSIVCGACAAEVPYGRLSCPSCGELLASVAGSRRGATALASRAPVPDVLYEPPAAPTATVVDGELKGNRRPARRVEPTRDPEAELPWGESTTDGAGDAFAASLDVETAAAAASPSTSMAPWVPGTSLSGSPTPSYLPRPSRRPHPTHPSVAEGEWPEPVDPDPLAEAPVALSPFVHPTTVAPAPPAPLAAAPASVPFAGAPVAAAPVGPASAAAFAGPGAYVPPLPVSLPAGPPAPAREYAGHGAEPVAEPESRPGKRVSPVIDGDARARILDFARWLSVAGSAFAAVGFLLPWGLVVIGSNDVSYFGRWGIAGPWHIIVALAVLANLGLALIENRVPIWIRTGLAGLGLGALLLGLVWPYITIAALGTGPGAIIAGIGAAGLVVSGILALVTDRHGEAPRPV